MTTVVVPSATAAPEGPPADDPGAALRALICGRREPCALVKEHDAGKDAAGRSLAAALFFVGMVDPDAEEGSAVPAEVAPANDEAGGSAPSYPDIGFEPDGETFEMESFGQCKRYEYWRIVREGTALVEADRLTEICNDGHGAAGAGQDWVTIGPNRIEIAMAGGSSWRWSEAATYSLSPFARQLETSAGTWTNGLNQEQRRIDWQAFSGSMSWFSPTCDKDGAPPESSEEEMPAGAEYAQMWVPSLPLETAFLTSGWRTTGLGRCAASFDATGVAGYRLSGKEGLASDTRLRVLASDGGLLFVEVMDDLVVAEDRLEVWTGPPSPTYGDVCVPVGATAGVLSWNVAVLNGKVTPGHGPPAASLAVERALDPGGAVRFRIVLPSPQKVLTIVYSDRDGGKKSERRIATSRLEAGRGATLGMLSPAGEHARCSVKDGVLVPEIKPEPLKNPP